MRSDRRRYRIRGITVLRSLNIENIAVIEKCNIEFDGGFNVLTGETGAGKSIIIDSINAVTGQRTSKELVRTGCDKAVVSAVLTMYSSMLSTHWRNTEFPPTTGVL